ncbi:hypothetical protein AMTRI_Chr03g53880 [Amborella trichopoda]
MPLVSSLSILYTFVVCHSVKCARLWPMLPCSMKHDRTRTLAI